jgi:hypothetical protein
MDSMTVYFKAHDIWSTLSTSLLTVLFLWVAYIVVGMVDKFVITPRRIKRIMNRQGVKGPSSHLILGNLPEFTMLKKAETKKDMKTGDYDIVSHILPFHVQNCQTYGAFFFKLQILISLNSTRRFLFLLILQLCLRIVVIISEL